MLLSVVRQAIYRPTILIMPRAAQLSPHLVCELTSIISGATVRQIRANTFYRKGDTSYSKISPIRWLQNEYLVAPTRQFQRALAGLCDAAILQPDKPTYTAAVSHLIRKWAAGGSFLTDPENIQGHFVRTWVLTTISLGLLRMDGGGRVQSEDAIASWLRELAIKVRDFHEKRRTKNNLSYWGALSIAASGKLLNDRSFIELASRWNADFLSAISVDGYLEKELARAQRALHYHAFAAQPLFVLNMVLAKRGEMLLDPRLRGLLEVVLAGIEGRTHTRFELNSQKSPTEIGWLALYCDEINREIPKQVRREEFIPRLGGRADLLTRLIRP